MGRTKSRQVSKEEVTPSICAPIFPNRHAMVALLGLLVCVGGYRLSLINAGHFAWGDERYHLPAEDLVNHLAIGEWGTATAQLFEARGPVPAARPGYVLLATVQVAAERAWADLQGIPRDAPAAFDAASAGNVIVTLGISLCVYLLAFTWSGGSSATAWIACFCYSLLANANMWIRHLVAYDEAMLLLLLGLCLPALTGTRRYQANRNGEQLDSVESKTRTAWGIPLLAGLLTGMGFACYPGYYTFVAINTAVAYAAYRRLSPVIFFLAGGGCVAIFFELLAQSVGASYLKNLGTLGGTITMGHPPETLLFLPKYLVAVEGPIGIMLMVLAGMLVTARVLGIVLRPPAVAMVAFSAAVGGYLFHAFMGTCLGRMVFYGRLIAMYLPFLVLFVAVGLAWCRHQAWKRAGQALLVVTAVYSFVSFATQYAAFTYPADLFFATVPPNGDSDSMPAHVLWDVPDSLSPSPAPQRDRRFVMVTETRPQGADVYVHLDEHAAIDQRKAEYVGVNLKWMFQIKNKDAPINDLEGYEVIAEAVHPSAAPWVVFEGFKPWERKRLLDRRYHMRVYGRQSSGEPARAVENPLGHVAEGVDPDSPRLDPTS